MENPVIIFGAKETGITALDNFQSNDVVVYCFLDDDASLHQTEIQNIPVLGTTDDEEYLKIIGKKCEVFIASEDSAVRKGGRSSPTRPHRGAIRARIDAS